ncbi:MAG: hypothetical protein GC178_07050 [Flavobacteriales bacterium]|nr:hypothetical protein [Flavobacteriales bacterium]
MAPVVILASCGKYSSVSIKDFSEGKDVKVSLDVSNADTSLTCVVFQTDISEKVICVPRDSLSNAETLVFGYDGKGESVFIVSGVFNDDTISNEYYAEGGYKFNLALSNKSIIAQ